MKQALIEYWKRNFNFSKELIDAFNDVPREKFVLKEYKKAAYEDIALPILSGQTISQPTTVMIMLNALEVKKGCKVLEIGTGSGYQTALLSKLIGKRGKLISLEILPELIEFAKKNLRNSEIKGVKIILSDGSLGYARLAPYDRIIVTAASPKINQVLVDQLKRNGILIIPVGGHFGQNLIKLRKNHNVITENLGDFLFVPLRGKKGYL